MRSLKSTQKLTNSISLVCSLLLLFIAFSSWGRCAPTTVEKSFDESDYVFSGTVSQIDEQSESAGQSDDSDSWNQDDLLTVHFTLDKKWKGANDNKTIAISTPSSDYWFICAIMGFSVGDNYVIFAKRVQEDEESGDSGWLYTDYCYGNKKLDDLSESKALFTQLDELQSEMQEDSVEEHDEETRVQEKQDSV